MVSKSAGSLYVLIFYAVVITFILGLLSAHYWVFDLISHFRLYHALGLLGLCMAGVLLNKKKYAIAAGALSIVCVAPVVKYYLPTGEEPVEERLKILSCNVLESNLQHDAVLALIRQEDPDIFVASDLNQAWEHTFKALSSSHPHTIKRVREDLFGIGLYSKLPFDTSDIVADKILGVPAVHAVVSQNLPEPLGIIGIHPVPPFWPTRFRQRNAFLKELVNLELPTAQETIVIGDFNSSSFAAGYRHALRNSSFRDSRLGFGWQTSWQSRVPGIRLSIDHAWITDGLQVVHREIGPDIGSDHYPLIVSLGWVKTR
ncbi:MAG: endonuclease/exonuclease/phosphatase family protein [Saprospiraceae bacterium]|nr:endonuclease/exonuclease/phosphatase family protein [Saprospiraceae bacterium]